MIVTAFDHNLDLSITSLSIVNTNISQPRFYGEMMMDDGYVYGHYAFINYRTKVFDLD